jgi:hypothetical protein
LTAIAAWALALGVLWGAAVLSFASNAAAAEPPTVEFMNPGPPSSCGSRPKVSSMSLPLGTPVVIVNNLNHDATLLVGAAEVLQISDGGAAELTLAPGQHDVWLVPDCVADRPIISLTVTITAPPESAGSSTGTSEAAPPPPPAGTSSAPRSTAPHRPRTSSATSDGVLVPASTVPDATNQPSADAAARPTASTWEDAVISARPVALTGEGRSKGLMLLAAVATICVLGVTAAIIRSIVRLSP